MPFNVELRDEHGAIIESIVGVQGLAQLLPPMDDDSSAVLRFVDPNGDTVINRLQAGPLLAELHAQYPHLASDADRDVLAAVVKLVERCATDVHLYVWLVGD